MNDRLSMSADELYLLSTRLIGDLTLQRDHLAAQLRATLPRDMVPGATVCDMCQGRGWIHPPEPLSSGEALVPTQ